MDKKEMGDSHMPLKNMNKTQKIYTFGKKHLPEKLARLMKSETYENNQYAF